MKKETVFVLAMAVIVLSCAGYSNATVLGTIESNRTGSSLGTPPEMIFSIFYPLPRDRDSMSFSWNVTTDDVGKMFFASSDTHENFDTFTYLLTNGIDNGLFLSDNHSIYVSNPLGLPEPIEYESTLITGIQNGVDFEGYTIGSIALTVNELFVDYHGTGPGRYTDYSYNITYTIYGAPIPEPATLLLFGIGAVLLRGRRRVR